tara:strand:+ start:2587 stop:3381 length:795 start_codon:yes stop_codon:yes gene_type:complete
MINSDTLYLLVLGAAGIYAIKTMDKRPRSHRIEGMETQTMKNKLAAEMGKITKYYTDEAIAKDGNNIEDTGTAEDSTNNYLYPFNDFITASDSNISTEGAKLTKEHQDNLINLRGTLATIYNLVDVYSAAKETKIQELQDKLEILGNMEELNTDAIVESTNSLKDQGLNKRRLIKNNEYFLNRYRAINDIIRYLILFIILVTVMQYLNIKGMFGEEFGGIIVAVFIACYLFFLWYKYIDVVKRNPLDYDEIMWGEIAPEEKNED